MPPLSPKAKALLKSKLAKIRKTVDTVKPPTTGKPRACPKCGSFLQKCPKCRKLTLRNNTYIQEWESNCCMKGCHNCRLVCAKCVKPV